MVINKDNVDDIENFVELALKTLMELERVLAEKFIIYFRLWIPTKDAAVIQQEVEAMPIDELNRKYEKILFKSKTAKSLSIGTRL